MSTLFLEAFGQLSPGTNLIDSEEEDLYSVFRARAELMGWTTASAGRQLLWGMNEAELTAGSDASRIGFVQVGLQVGELERIEVPPPAESRFPLRHAWGTSAPPRTGYGAAGVGPVLP